MPVNTEHPEFKERQEQWIMCRETIEGAAAVKRAGMKYLPKLTAQTGSEYEAYKARALFYGAANRTVQGLVGAVFRKEFTYEYPYPDHIKIMSVDGMDLWEVARRTVKEVLTTGRYGILTDTNEEHGRAFAAPYLAENIINWRTELIRGKIHLTMVVLKEKYKAPERADDTFSYTAKDQYRVLKLVQDPERAAFRYEQQVWRQSAENAEVWVIVETIVPTYNGVPLDRIPFVFFNTHQGTPATEKPPLMDMVEVNLSHYRTSADMEHGAHYTALPTAWIAGFDPDKDFKIGSSVAWVSDKTDARAGFLEFQGQGLGALRDLKKDKEHLMAILGARLLEDQRRAAEAADTYRIRQSGEGGALSAIVRTVSSGIRRVLQEVAAWNLASPSQLEAIKFQLNNDFIAERMKPEELRQLMETWQQGGISQDTFLYQLKQGEVLPAGRSIEEEKAKIEVETGGTGGSLPGGVPAGGNVIPMKREFELVKSGGNTTGIREV